MDTCSGSGKQVWIVLARYTAIFTKKNVALCLALTLIAVVCLMVYSETSVEMVPQAIYSWPGDRDAYKTVYTESLKPRNITNILLWTTFFGDSWYSDIFNTVCPLGCRLTTDKRELEDSDAVVFHMADSIKQGLYINPADWFKFPKHRSKDQVWIMSNLEPLPQLWGDVQGWQDMINWTWSYSLDADIRNPYGSFRKLNASERLHKSRKWSGINWYNEHPKKGALWIVSNCYDDARRYRVARTIKKYISVNIYGHCGEPCPKGSFSECNNLFNISKFYLALENSDCKDYISEKFWRSLERHQIPIVAWKYGSQFKHLVPPHSYINVYDFPDLDTAGKYIAEVDSNETLYNSYFEWLKEYTVSGENAWCQICKKLKDGTIRYQSYHDLQGWFEHDMCRFATVILFFNQFFKMTRTLSLCMYICVCICVVVCMFVCVCVRMCVQERIQGR